LDSAVNFSRLLSLTALGIAIVITVPLKLSDFAAVEQRLSHNLEQASTAFLAREGFETENGKRFGFFLINAQDNNCQLQLREAASEGFNADAIRADTPKDTQLVFEYRGKLWISHPTFRAAVSKAWNRLKWRLGVDSSWSPVISIAAVGRCAIETLPWDELATIRAN
jgi:hypothetical protein